MGLQSLCEFNKLADACGSSYAAVRWLSKESRRLGVENSCYHILESKLLTWALTGKCPYTRSQLAFRKLAWREHQDDLEDILEFVSDEDVADLVRSNYSKSVKNRHLTLCDHADLGESRLNRANILLRMAWYQFNTD